MATLEPVSVTVHIGIDLGQRHDPTAICVAELQLRGYTRDWENWPQGGTYHYAVRFLERLALGTPYPAVVGRLVEVYGRLTAQGHAAQMWIDATGVGQPVVDLLNAADLYPTAVYLTGTDKAVQEGGALRLGKALLVSRLQVLLQAGRVHLPQTPEAQALVNELLNYEIRVNEEAHAQFGAFKTGTHDDLATALGLACWQEPSWLLY